MAVKLRLTRMGRRHRPFFRINAVEALTPRDGKILEKVGHYDPLEKDAEKQIILNKERVEYWLSKGAVPSDTVSEILLRQGIKHKYAAERKTRRDKARAVAHKKGRLFTKAERILAEKKKAQQQEAKGSGEAAAGGAAQS
jgi:small subunit ribosomal protein S16